MVAMSTPPVPAAPTPRSILEDLVLTPVPGCSGRYGVVVDDGWRVLHVFGGMTKALALRAAAEALGRPDLRLVTTGATYVAPIAAGPVGIQADVIRSGRRGAQVRVRLWSGPATDEPRGDLLVDAVFGAHDDALPGLAPVVLPADARAPDASTGRDELARSRVVDVPFHRQTDWRLAVGTYDFTAPPDDPRTVSWFRFRNSAIGPGDAWDPAALAVPGDILGPAFSRGIGPARHFFVITLQLSMQWFAPVRSEWVCQESSVSRAAGGFVTGVSNLFDESGELVGLATQCAMLRPLERVAADGLSGAADQG